MRIHPLTSFSVVKPAAGFAPADRLARVAPLDVAGMDLPAIEQYAGDLDQWESDGGAVRDPAPLWTRKVTLSGLPVLALPCVTDGAVLVVDNRRIRGTLTL